MSPVTEMLENCNQPMSGEVPNLFIFSKHLLFNPFYHLIIHLLIKIFIILIIRISGAD